MDIKFAFAVNSNNHFEKNHFGDSDKFMIYGVESGKLKFLSEQKNIFKDHDESKSHGLKKKGLAIVNFLKGQGVNVLVSMQFGRNIRIINEHFIPIVIYYDNTEQVINILNHHMHWIADELQNSSTDYKLFTIKSGILKSVIKK